VKELLARALGTSKDKNDHREEFLDLFGVWTEADKAEFQAVIKDLEAVHREDWK
jgi:hypothetical protein